MQEGAVLEMRGICKYFPGVRALQNVDFTLREGEIHALMGENGAGKSTLIKGLTGVYEKDNGEIILKGKEGAVSIHRFVQPDTSLTIGRNRRDFIQLDKDNLFLTGYDSAARQEAAAPAPGLSFRDTHGTLTEEQVKTETARCLGCGASVVDPNKCIGCGICTTKCEFDAIHLSRDLPACSTMVRTEDKFKAILPYMVKRGLRLKFGRKG